ncbi:hypothetical protein CO726_28645 [Bacillus fungorum]|uniref:Uncharacterized protein n=1 Tax=Bacillus fungorum TaxID=2039284 RepID=A0A2G6Q5M3_9BACI|nr:hypothetical protein CO726_28645 [Bacillus fungorum]
MLLTQHWLFPHLSYVDFVLQMIFPSFSPPFYKFRNICQKTIKYTNYDYSKTKNAERWSFKKKISNLQQPLKPSVSRDWRILLIFFVLRIPQTCCKLVDMYKSKWKGT